MRGESQIVLAKRRAMRDGARGAGARVRRCSLVSKEKYKTTVT